MLPILYIDPGTGSALFSIAIGVAATLFFVFQALWIRLKTFILGGKALKISKHYHDYVIYCEGRQYVNVFKPVLEEFETRGIELLYLTGAENDPALTAGYANIKCEYIGEGNRAFARLNFLSAGIVLMTTPGLDVFQLRRSKKVAHYSHILHDTGDVTCYRLFGIDRVDSILLSGGYQKNDLFELERLRGTQKKELVVVGSTYMDVLLEKKEHLKIENPHPFTILVSPSWGPGSLLNQFGETLLDPLIATGWRIIVRPHPQSKKSEKDLLSRLEKRYTGTSIIFDYTDENLFSLSRADIMISDFSSIIFDFVFLFQKPVLYANAYFELELYDASDLSHLPWKLQIVGELGKELTENQLPNIKEIISDVVKNPETKVKCNEVKNIAWQYIGESGKRTADYLISKQKELAKA